MIWQRRSPGRKGASQHMDTSEPAAAYEAELRVVEEDLARLREEAADLRRRIGEREDEPTDPAERSALIEQAEEQEALIDMLKARREELLRNSACARSGIGPACTRPRLSGPGVDPAPAFLTPTAVSGESMSSKDLPSASIPQASSTNPPMIMMPPPRYPTVRPVRSVPPPITASSPVRHDCTGASPARDGRRRRKRMKRLRPLSGPAHRSCRAGESWRFRCRRACCVPPVPPQRVPRIGAPG